MPNDKLTWADFRNHLHYGKWVYLLIAVAAWFIFDLAYQMTAYRAPDERKVDIELVQSVTLDEPTLTALADRALIAGQAIDPTLEEVNLIHIQYSGDPDTDYYGVQKYTVMLSAQEGDLWVVPRVLFDQLHSQAALIPLDDYIAQGILNVDGLDLTDYTLPAPATEQDDQGAFLPPNGTPAIYGLPATMVPALAQAGYTLDDACMCIVTYSTNPETAAAVWMALSQEAGDA